MPVPVRPNRSGRSAAGSTVVGFVGAGSMGAPMVERLLAAGTDVQLYARKAETCERFAALGATIAPSLAALAEVADLLIVCPFSPEQLLQITDGPDGLLAHARPGTVLVQHATVSAETIEELATRAEPVRILDAPISGRAEEIRVGQLSVLAGGDRAALALAEPHLRTYAGTIVHTGGVGTATKVKLVNNLVFAAQMQIAGAAVSLGEQLGIAPADLLTALTACSASSFAFSVLREMGDVEVFAGAAAPYLRKDVALAEQSARQLGLDTGTLGETVRRGPFNLTS